MLALAGLSAITGLAAAQDLKSPSSDLYVPRLGDIMGALAKRRMRRCSLSHCFLLLFSH